VDELPCDFGGSGLVFKALAVQAPPNCLL
jgi:hypothetical protein